MEFHFTVVAILLLYFFALVAIATTQSRFVPWRALSLFRVLFPSWRFYEEVVGVPVLSYRVSGTEKDFGQWVQCVTPLERRWDALLLNPRGNLVHACNSLLHQLENDIEQWSEPDTENFSESVSYNLVNCLVRHHIESRGDAKAGAQYQFQVSSVLQGSGAPSDPILISRVHDFA